MGIWETVGILTAWLGPVIAAYCLGRSKGRRETIQGIKLLGVRTIDFSSAYPEWKGRLKEIIPKE